MADSDPISESTPVKRRKLNPTSLGKQWDEDNDSGDDLFEEHNTVATLPVTASQRPQLSFSNTRMYDELNTTASNTYQCSPVSHVTQLAQTLERPYITQPTQPLGSQTLNHVTQPTQPLKPLSPLSDDVLVGCSSPPAAPSSDTLVLSPTKPAPVLMSRAPFSRPNSLLASAMAPPGTAFRRPAGVQSNPQTTPEVVDLADESDDDPRVNYSSDEGTQGLRSNIRPTIFTKGGRGLNSSPNRSSREKEGSVVKESPANLSAFGASISQFTHTESLPAKTQPADDMASAYGGVSRTPKAQMRQTGLARAQPATGSPYQHLDDITDYRMRKSVEQIQAVLTGQSVARCMDALKRKHGNVADSMEWLAATSTTTTVGDADELAPTPMRSGIKGVARGVAYSSSQPSQQAVKNLARQDVKAPTKTIAEKYGNQAARKPSQPSFVVDDDDEEDDAPKPRRRLIQRGKPVRSPSPKVPLLQKKSLSVQKSRERAAITIDSDSEEDSGIVTDEEDEVEEVHVVSSHEVKLLSFFNESSVREIADLCAQPEQDVQIILDKRPFSSLEEIRVITNAPEFTKSGKKSRTKPIGDKIVDACSEMMAGYSAVDDLVTECEAIAKPIQDAIKSWGVGEGNGELQLMNLDEAHDSGIGTPASSYHVDSPARESSTKNKPKGRFLGQPENMSADVTLKDYQLVGLNWLNLLWSKKLSCILADDMGLGKTCQVISFLSHLRIQQVDGVHLVIVPGSTLENWLREFQHFSPELKVRPYYGSQAERPALQADIEADFDTIDVVVTTYDMAMKPDDNRFLRGLGPAVCIYDEAHALRNPNSDRYRQLMRIPADFKILLTGTPLQNNLQELIAILAFIMPDLFSKKQEDLNYIFQHKATTKDADHAALLSAQRIARARAMMTPFILRRKKQQVLWLPAKHSRVEYLDMTDSQANAYADELEAAQKVFADKVKGKKSSAKTSSNVLMNLRKTAIHPLLSRRIYDDKKLVRIRTALLKSEEFGGNTEEKIWNYLTGDKGPQSIKGGDFGLHRFCTERPYLHKYALKKQEWMDCGKVKKFKELVMAYAKNGDRALVFSQFTTLMDILEAVLETLNIRYMRLDGSTRMDIRQDMLDKFAAEEDITVFMLSTKAGGAGINLACANKVIIFDSGFNPQDDIQAENRAHRVGQTRDVEVVRLVTRGTIEEQIHALGESKLALDERVAGEGASVGDEKAAEKEGEKAVEAMLMKSLEKKESGSDLKDEFKKGLEGAGLNVA